MLLLLTKLLTDDIFFNFLHSEHAAAEVDNNVCSLTVSYGAQLLSSKSKSLVLTLSPRVSYLQKLNAEGV